MKNLFLFLVFAFFGFFLQGKRNHLRNPGEKLAESAQSWNGDSLPAYPSGQPKITILKVTVPPNQRLEWHKHLFINAGFLLKGEITVISEKKDTLLLKAGDPIIELVNTLHYGINDGPEIAKIIVV